MPTIPPLRRGKDYDYASVANIIVAKRKVCASCRIEKPFDEFPRNRNHPTGYFPNCKTCESVRFAEWRQRNMEKVRFKDRVNHYKRTYGLQHALAEELANDRVDVCAICNKHRKMTVDHDHQTGAVRGLICARCNNILGHAHDDVSVLESAIKYLKGKPCQ